MQNTKRILGLQFLVLFQLVPKGLFFSPSIPEPTISVHPVKIISPIPQTRHAPKLSISFFTSHSPFYTTLHD